jgi:Holliday junction resolvasome RuvABC endonuclease subunit
VPTFLGDDPGLAHQGLALIESERPSQWTCLGLRCVVTRPSTTKTFSRTALDELDRIKTMHDAVARAAERGNIAAIGVENYSVFRTKEQTSFENAVKQLQAAVASGQPEATILELANRVAKAAETGMRDGFGLGRASKTQAVYGAGLAVGFQRNVVTYSFEPADKKKFLGLKGTGAELKRQIIAAVREILPGFSALLDEKVPQKTLHEHVADAAVIAIMTAERWHVRR